VRARGQVDPVFVDPVTELPDVLEGVLQDGDMLAILGAGDIGVVAGQLRAKWCIRGEGQV
jgi:UDP-N-acetylmuramate--alanine ligase